MSGFMHFHAVEEPLYDHGGPRRRALNGPMEIEQEE
jgi:hypothetical protein